MAVAVSTIGQRDRYVTILSRPSEDAVDDSGAPIEGPWSVMGQAWMGKAAATGFDRSAERYTDEQWSARVETVWHMPYQAAMDPDQVDVPKLRRLVFGALTHDIARADLLAFEDGQQIRLWTRARSGS